MSRTQTSGFGTMGAAFLYFDALKRHAIFVYLYLTLIFRSFKYDPPESQRKKILSVDRLANEFNQNQRIVSPAKNRYLQRRRKER